MKRGKRLVNKIYVTRKLPEMIREELQKHFEITEWNSEERPVPREVLLEKTKDVDGIFCMVTDQIDAEVINEARNLKVISNLAVGFNNIDVNLANEKDIIVTNTPDVLTDTTADLTFALLMATARKLIDASERLRKGDWKAWSPMQFTGKDISGSTLGVIGLGRIGEALVERAKGFDMKVIYHNRNRKIDKEAALDIEYRELEDLLMEVDFLVLLLPYSSEVYHFIGEKELSLMKKEAILINTARGGLVDEKALYQALNNKEIWAAGLDVFEEEPVAIDHPLLSLSNVTTLPHIGSASENTRLRMCQLVVDNLVNVLNGKEPITPIKY